MSVSPCLKNLTGRPQVGDGLNVWRHSFESVQILRVVCDTVTILCSRDAALF